MRDKMSLIGGTLLLIVVIASMSLFTVDQRQYAIVFQLGEIKDALFGHNEGSSSPRCALAMHVNSLIINDSYQANA